jgi:hypothetical protein
MSAQVVVYVFQRERQRERERDYQLVAITWPKVNLAVSIAPSLFASLCVPIAPALKATLLKFAPIDTRFADFILIAEDPERAQERERETIVASGTRTVMENVMSSPIARVEPTVSGREVFTRERESVGDLIVTVAVPAVETVFVGRVGEEL